MSHCIYRYSLMSMSLSISNALIGFSLTSKCLFIIISIINYLNIILVFKLIQVKSISGYERWLHVSHLTGIVCQSLATFEISVSCHDWDVSHLPWLRYQSLATFEISVSCHDWDVSHLPRLRYQSLATIEMLVTCHVGDISHLPRLRYQSVATIEMLVTCHDWDISHLPRLRC